MTLSINEEFKEVEESWDLDSLYKDLASAKGKHLTPIEKLHLRGLLIGHSPTEIAEKLKKNPQGVKTDLCSSIYKYVKNLVDKCEEKVENWRNIRDWLEEARYNNFENPQLKGKELLPDKTVVNVNNIIIEKNQIVFLIDLRVPMVSKDEKLNDNSYLSDNKPENN
jgi:hypothetical protein